MITSIAANRAQSCSRNNRKPISAQTAPTSRAAYGPPSSNPCSRGPVIDTVPGDTSTTTPMPPRYAAIRKKTTAMAVTPVGRRILIIAPNQTIENRRACHSEPLAATLTRRERTRNLLFAWTVDENYWAAEGVRPYVDSLPSPAHPILRDFHQNPGVVQLSPDGIRPFEIPSAARGFDLRDFFLNLFIGNALCAK